MKKVILLLLTLISIYSANAQWERTNGPYGGVVQCLAVKGSNIFAGTNGAGVFLSSDSGASWTAVNNGLGNSSSVVSFAFRDSNIFVGTNNGLFLSTDNGASWTDENYYFTNKTIYALAISDTNLIASTGDGILVSANNGYYWTSGNNGINATYTYALAVSGTNIFAGTDNGVFLSTDNAGSWTPVSNGLPNATTIQSIAIYGSNIFLGTSGAGMYLSSNNGGSWAAINNGLPTNSTVYSVVKNGSNIFTATDQGVFLSTNNGAKWTAVNNGLTNTDARSLAISGIKLFAGTNGHGIFSSSNNGAGWALSTNGLANISVSAFGVSGNDVLANGAGAFLSSDNGYNWMGIHNGLPNYSITSFAKNGNNIFVGTSGYGVFFSSNNGASFTVANNGLGNDIIKYNINCLVINGSNVFAGTYNGVFLSSNNGTNWTAINNGLPTSNAIVLSLAIDGSHIFAGTDHGVFLSSDTGASWTHLNFYTNGEFYALAVSGTTIYAGTSGGVYFSSDTGATWTWANNNAWTTSLAVSGNDIFVATGSGVNFSCDNGAHWKLINTGLTNTVIDVVAVNANYVFAGTSGQVNAGGGVWRRSLAEINGFDLKTTGTTTFDYQILSHGPIPVSAKIFNAGLQTVTSAKINYRINGGATVSANISPCYLMPDSAYTITHPIQWNPPAVGKYTVDVWTEYPNGVVDKDTTNDHFLFNVFVVDTFVTRNTCLEEFTGTWCGNCPAATYRIDSIVLPTVNNYTVIKYHTFSSSADAYVTPQDTERVDYYNITGVPWIELDGQWDEVGGWFYAYTFNNYESIPSLMSIDIASATYDGTTVYVDGAINPFWNYDTAQYVYQVVVTEKLSTLYPGYNGEKSFSDVMLKMSPSSFGTPIASINANVAIPFNETISLTGTPYQSMSDLRVVVFVQNNNDKKILQSAWKDVDFSTSIAALQSADEEIFVYPNPSKNKFTISFRNDLRNSLFKIFDLMGAEVYSETVNGKQVVINTNLSSGIYFVKVIDDEAQYVQKLIVE